VPVTAAKPYSIDQNLWHTSYEGGILEDPAVAPNDDMFQLTRDPSLAPDEPAFVEIAFESGLPVAVNGRRLGPAELVSTLNSIAGAHGVGRTDLVENRLVGMKSRGVYETPAGTVLMAALRDLESLTLDRETHHFRETISTRYAELVYYGLWHSPLRAAFDSFLETSHRWVTGTVRMKLFKGFALAVARSSPSSLYRHDLATFGEDGVYDQKDAAGFNNLWALPTRVVAAVRREAAGEAAAETPASVSVGTECARIRAWRPDPRRGSSGADGSRRPPTPKSTASRLPFLSIAASSATTSWEASRTPACCGTAASCRRPTRISSSRGSRSFSPSSRTGSSR